MKKNNVQVRKKALVNKSFKINSYDCIHKCEPLVCTTEKNIWYTEAEALESKIKFASSVALDKVSYLS